ncbi:MAG: succinate dehydrogenase/fumarate reductase iron-sulfur subunit [Deltaproteobacteria bacterium]|nr:succinate dehydrogenase/fumarate reductase iron-sulfur subunit [Deltaproteobacteria bacterium]
MRIVIHAWRQASATDRGGFARFEASDVRPDMSFLEMLDVINEELITKGVRPIAFESDCREGICGTCGFMINGIAHGPVRGIATCELRMRHFRDGDELWLEPFRARAFPVIKDLVVDRGALDRIFVQGGYISIPTGSAPEANTIPVPKEVAERALDAAACIGCGACVAACPNASAALFTGAKIAHLSILPQGWPERRRRVTRMADAARKEGFGHCTLIGECAAACPAEIKLEAIARMNREWLAANLRGDA